MAERYLALLRAVQPEGAYRLGGYCFGGLVAYEIACRLVARGKPLPIWLYLKAMLRWGRVVGQFGDAHVNGSISRAICLYWIGDYIEQGGTESWSCGAGRG